MKSWSSKVPEPKVGSDISPWGKTWLMFMAIVHLIIGDWQAYHEFNLSPIRVGKLWNRILIWNRMMNDTLGGRPIKQTLFHKWPWRQKQWTPLPFLIFLSFIIFVRPVTNHNCHQWLFYRFFFWLVPRAQDLFKLFWSTNSPKIKPIPFEFISAETTRKSNWLVD